MIKYALRCADGHAFDSWFASASAYDSLAETDRLTCAVCGGGGVQKAMMSPRLGGGEAEHAGKRPLAPPASPAETALAEFRRRVEANTEDVGRRFAAEARAIHEGEAPERAIRGQASGAEARALVEDGVPVLPLPFFPERQMN